MYKRQLHDTVVEYEVTSNRVDCYSILGIAREAAATFKKPFVPPVVSVKGNGEDVNKYISVEVKDTDLCTRYCARAVSYTHLCTCSIRAVTDDSSGVTGCH